MENLSLTIIIPTYNRKDTLKKCLNAVFNQTYPKTDYEVIVIDDGSTDGTEELVNSLLNDSPCALLYFKQENKGPAAARNVGIKNAYGKIILFIGDDIIATPTLLDEHIKWHKEHPDDNVAVLGYITWSPEIKITPFMHWLENGGPQFCLNNLKDVCEVDWRYFITPNISLKKKFIADNNLYFDERFPYAMLEDTELGYRLYCKGMRLLFDKSAIAYHYHYASLNDSCNRMSIKGSSLRILEKVNPILFRKVAPIRRHTLKHRLLANSLIIRLLWFPLARLLEKHWCSPKIYGIVMGYYYLKGYHGNK